jgi:tetratricopeptide (TPR) repeat protein
LATAYRFLFRIDDGLAECERALEVAEALGNEIVRVSALPEYGGLMTHAGRLGEAAAVIEDAMRSAEALNVPWLVFHSGLMASYNNYARLDADTAAGFVRRILANDRASRAPMMRFAAHANLSSILAHSGRMTEAQDHADEARGLDITFAEQFLDLETRLGNWEKVTEITSRNIAYSEQTGYVLGNVSQRVYLAGMWAAKGEPEKVVETLVPALEIAVSKGAQFPELWIRAELALALARCGRRAEAVPHVARGREILALGEDWGARAGHVDLAEAVVLCAGGDQEKAVPFFERAISLFQTFTQRWLEAEALHEWGKLPRDATKLAAAIEIYERIDAPAFWADRVRADLPA